MPVATTSGASTGARLRRLRVVLALGALAAMTACTEQPATEQAQQSHRLFYIILALAVFVFLVVEGGLLWAIVRYRRRRGDDEEPPQRYGTTRMIIAFFLFGTVIVVALFPSGELAVANIDKNPTPIVTIDVTGSQWQWAAVYKNEGVVVTGKSFVRPLVMEIPVDEPIRIRLVSNDVMHEFFVPEFYFMRNALPGHPNVFTWTPTTIGTYRGQCAEFCGLGHYQMRVVVKVVNPTDYQAWVQAERKSILKINCAPLPGNDLQLTAHNIAWNTNCLAITAGQPASVTVHNLDSGIDHNFAIWNGIDTTHQFFSIPKFSGVATHAADLPQEISQLKPGKYYFQCNVHGPAMSGVFIVEPPGSGQGGG
jgi:cytochrome c oxidase subunit II